MGYALLWAEVVGAGVLLATLTAALAARTKPRWLRLYGAALLTGLLFCLGALVVVLLGVLRFKARVEPNWFLYALSALLAYAAGSAAVLASGLRCGDGGVPRAASWPRARLVLVFSGAAALTLITFWNLDAAARAEIESARVEAGALALSVAPPRVPDAANAAFFYERAWQALPDPASLPDDRRRKISEWEAAGGRPGLDLADTDLVEYLRQCAPALALARRSAAMPGCHFDRDYGRPSVAMLLPEVAHMRRLVRLLVLESRARIAAGDTSGAFENLAAVRGITAHLAGDPILLVHMVAGACAGIQKAGLENALATGAPNIQDLAKLTSEDSLDLARSYVRVLRMEEAFGLSAMSSVSGLGAIAALTGTSDAEIFEKRDPVGLMSVWRVFFLRLDLVSYRDAIRRAQRLAARPWHESRGPWRELTDRADRRRAGILTQLLMPALYATAERANLAEAANRLTRLAAASAAFRLKHGRYPARAEEVVPEFVLLVPLDPFDGRPLRMVRADGGLVLYSVGPDGVDDGGREYDGQTKTGDITFCLGAGPYQARRGGK